MNSFCYHVAHAKRMVQKVRNRDSRILQTEVIRFFLSFFSDT
uniref:Uncharacterized protein n=1 Tax=Arundo donax TaxID=35708 RepID=A0A0A8ZE16_ARUDO